ncbi:NAD-dependent epimerase/dehydratase family protein [Pendulispora brunnea]|uniref:NAD-dependent epimerase/dehydratase family protein n=1 Tax=Pendulispora brunnea TaxID=2905690 RepID=A0ABZ2KGC1_9BACT
MKILVTGATGFLGRRVLDLAIERGHNVVALVRPTSDLGSLPSTAAQIVSGQLEDRESLPRALEGVHLVYHCAARSSDWGSWKEFHSSNVIGVRNLLEVAARTGTVERFLHVSTTDVYGYPSVACEEDAGVRDVGLPYGRSKGLAEQEVMRVHRETGLPVTIVRPASIYGPRSKDWIVEIGRLLVQREMLLVDGGRARAGLIFVDDVVEAMMAAAASPRTVGQAYNLRHPDDTTWQTFCDALADVLGVPRPRRNLPSWLLLGVGAVLESAYALLRISRRPLVTRHAVMLFGRDQGFPIHKAVRDFGFDPTFDLDAGLGATRIWLDSEDGRRAVPRPDAH